MNEYRDALALPHPLRLVGAGHALALPPVRNVPHHRHREVHRLRIHPLTGRDGVKPRLQFPQLLHKVLRREMSAGMGAQKINVLHAPKVLIQVFLPQRVQQFLQQRRRLPAAVRHLLDKLPGGLPDIVILSQHSP